MKINFNLKIILFNLKIYLYHLLIMAADNIKQFNQILSSFLSQLGPLIGTTYYVQYKLIIKCTAQLPLEQFLIYALPIREKIMNKDESFFANKENHIKTVGDNKDILDDIIRLHNIYEHLNAESKSNVWDIFQALLHLGEEYIRNTKG